MVFFACTQESFGWGEEANLSDVATGVGWGWDCSPASMRKMHRERRERSESSRRKGALPALADGCPLSSRSLDQPRTSLDPARSGPNPTPTDDLPGAAMALATVCSVSQTRTSCAASHKPAARSPGLLRRVLRPPPAPAAQTEAPPPKEHQAEVRDRVGAQATAGGAGGVGRRLEPVETALALPGRMLSAITRGLVLDLNSTYATAVARQKRSAALCCQPSSEPTLACLLASRAGTVRLPAGPGAGSLYRRQPRAGQPEPG